MKATSAAQLPSQTSFIPPDQPHLGRQQSHPGKLGLMPPPTGLSLPPAAGSFESPASKGPASSGPSAPPPFKQGAGAKKTIASGSRPSRAIALGGLNLPSEAFTPAQGANPWTSLAPPTAAGSGGMPDYFSCVHQPDPEGDGTGTRIASPFALPTPSSDSVSAAKTPFGAPASEPHPWASLFGDAGGMPTALPDGGLGRSSLQAFAVPPTPAANPGSVPLKKTPSGSELQLPRLPSSSLSLPDPNALKLPNGFMSRGASATSSASATSRASSRASSRSGEDLSRFKALDADGLAQALLPPAWASEGKSAVADDVLVLDIRPSTSFQTARIRSSINICAPSTLLKRPGITVERIEQDMLGGPRDRRRFMRWRKGPLRADPSAAAVSKKAATFHTTDEPGINRIVVLDTDTGNVGDTGNATAGGGGPCLIGMLKKFEIAGFAGELCWLQGGFNGLANTAVGKTLVESGPASHGEGHEQAHAHERGGAVFADRSAAASPMPMQMPLPTEDTQRPSSMDSGRKGSLVRPRGLPMEAFKAQSTITGWPGMPQAERTSTASQPEPAVEHAGSVRQAPEVLQNACANPFFDNIRQNRELAHGITEKIPMDLPEMSRSQVDALPRFLRELVDKTPEERATTLAQSFFDVEKAEQQRLIATMQQHAAESGQDPRIVQDGRTKAKDVGAASRPDQLSPSSIVNDLAQPTQQDHKFPFSISAALERGADNRYNNIWTYEHSRVKLSKPQVEGDPGSDYLNGSFVAPARRFGSRRKYIATQAPLPSTFEAFWTTIWEQNSRVIVMLTREHESGRLQSHPYWNDSEFGASIRVDKFEEVVLDEHGRQMSRQESRSILQPASNGGGLFPSMPASSDATHSPESGTPTTIRRTFRLRNLAEPNAPARRITQLQYIAWPDYHIPETPDTMLDLMDAADALQNEADSELRQTAVSSGQSASLDTARAGPMVVHCSAGVGRTGAFIVIDSALDVLRRFRRRQRTDASISGSDDGAVDLPTWQNTPVEESKGIDGVEEDDSMARPVDVEMPLATPSRRRSTRRSLKRELSPTGMDLDGNPDDRHREISSPPPTLRTRSSDGGGAGQEGGFDVGSWSSTSSSAVGTPSRAFGSLQIESSASPGFANPFTSKFGAAPFSLDRSAVSVAGGAADESSSSSDTIVGDRGPSRFLFGPASSNTSSSLSAGRPSQFSTAEYRNAAGSSPFSEASAPTFPTGTSSARSSFSSSSGAFEKPSIELRRTESAASSGVGQPDEAPGNTSTGSAESFNPFEAALGPSKPGSNTTGPRATANGNGSAPGTGSNEPTPFPTLPSAPTFTFSSLSPAKGRSDGGDKRQSEEAVKVDLATTRVLEDGEDIIRKTVDTAREQRMSLIQTCRQYVFVYSAVLAALLRDMDKEAKANNAASAS